MDYEAINRCIQNKMVELSLDKVKLIEAANWLDTEGLLKDNPNRPGTALRKIIETEITGAKKEKNLWFIYPVNEKTKTKKAARKKPATEEVAALPDKAEEQLTDIRLLHSLVNDHKALKKRIKTDPIDLVAEIRDQTRISVMQVAQDVLSEYDKTTNMGDTITLLYNNKTIGKVTVQCLHVIRKMGNLAQYEKEHLDKNNSTSLAEMVCLAFNLYFNEVSEKELIRS